MALVDCIHTPNSPNPPHNTYILLLLASLDDHLPPRHRHQMNVVATPLGQALLHKVDAVPSDGRGGGGGAELHRSRGRCHHRGCGGQRGRGLWVSEEGGGVQKNKTQPPSRTTQSHTCEVGSCTPSPAPRLPPVLVVWDSNVITQHSPTTSKPLSRTGWAARGWQPSRSSAGGVLVAGNPPKQPCVFGWWRGCDG